MCPETPTEPLHELNILIELFLGSKMEVRRSAWQRTLLRWTSESVITKNNDEPAGNSTNFGTSYFLAGLIVCRVFPIVLFKCFFCMLCRHAHPKHIFSRHISTHLGCASCPAKGVCVIYLWCITRNGANHGPFPFLLLKWSSPVGLIWSMGHVGVGWWRTAGWWWLAGGAGGFAPLRYTQQQKGNTRLSTHNLYYRPCKTT